MFQNLKEIVIQSILMDDLDRARLILKNPPEDLALLSTLLIKVKDKSLPLVELKAEKPVFVAINTSYTCGVGCKMCNSGFHNRTFLYDDYKYFLPEQFEKLSPWLKSASNIIFVGAGETLESPYMTYFLEKTKDKESHIYTSGVPLNRKMIQSLIKSKLKTLILSFEGETSLGHGAGKKNYIKKFWEKAEIIQKVKWELDSSFPVVQLLIAVNGENIDNLEKIIQTASRHFIRDIMFSSMTPFNELMYKNSIFADFENSKRKINSIISRWNKKGMHITFLGQTTKMQDSIDPCPYVDNWINFHGKMEKPNICCGSIELPVNISNDSKDNSWNSFPLRYFRYLHFCSNGEKVPYTCQNCWAMDLKQYSQNCAKLYSHPENGEKNEDPTPLYRSASELKRCNQLKKAQELFTKVLTLKIGPEIKGKTYFHLGEIQLVRKDYTRALSYMKLAVQYLFNHEMAFAYLYLLLMLVENPKPIMRRKKFNLGSLSKDNNYGKKFSDV